jgi:hypothetical protein
MPVNPAACRSATTPYPLSAYKSKFDLGSALVSRPFESFHFLITQSTIVNYRDSSLLPQIEKHAYEPGLRILYASEI